VVPGILRERLAAARTVWHVGAPFATCPFREDHLGTQQVAVCRREGLLKDRDECWFLMTNPAFSVQKLWVTDHGAGTVPRREKCPAGLGVPSDPDQASGTVRPPVADSDAGSWWAWDG
jgi:hypothetical protein